MAPRTANLQAKEDFNKRSESVELAHLGYMPKGCKYNPNDKRESGKPTAHEIESSN